jgi:uncharacterized protein YndB with AHSA1/START domain
MDALAITRSIDIDAPIDRVWSAITQADLIAQWFGDTCEFDAVPGGALLPNQIPVPHDLVCEGTAWSAKAPSAADDHEPIEHRPFWADGVKP